MKAYHTGVVGDSGGGKTTLLREIFHDPGFRCRCVWVNHNDEDGLGGRGGRDAETVDSAAGLRSSTARSVNFRVDDQMEGTRAAVEFARDYFAERGVPVQVFVDESHNVLEDEPGNPLKWALHEGRDEGVVLRVATQDPSEWPYTPLKQIKFLAWVGEWSVWHEGFLNAHSWLDRDRLPTSNYEYVVINKRGQVVYRGETKEQYG